MSTPYTRDELKKIDDVVLLSLIREKSPRLYPYCLVGQHIEEAKKKYAEWTKDYKDEVEILVANNNCSLMDIRKTYLYCELDENDVITGIYYHNK